MDKNAFTAASRIPEGAGKNPVTAARIKSTVNFYKALVVLALASFLLSGNPRLQNAALAILFPGEAFVGLGGLWLIGLPVTLLLFALSLFLWFATGNIIAPFVTWPGLALLVPSLPAAGSTTSHGVYTVTGLAALAYYSLTRWANKLRATTVARRETRNAVLPKVIAELQEQTKQTPTPRDLELDPELLGRLRYLIQVSLQDQDDFKNFDTVEQFQPSAIRYQITEMVYALAFANRFYTPSFRCGYLHEGQKGLLKKYCQEKVLWYWKYEALWGALTTDYDPVKKDNIMLTGFLLLATALFENATCDDTFSQKASLDFEITKRNRSPNSSATLANALLDNMDDSPYCLFACELRLAR